MFASLLIRMSPRSSHSPRSQFYRKTAVVKILTALGESGEITAKQYGKQFVYVARQVCKRKVIAVCTTVFHGIYSHSLIQDILECPSIEELEELDTQINELKESNIALQASVKQQQAVLTGLTSALTDGQIQERLAVLQVEVGLTLECECASFVCECVA